MLKLKGIVKDYVMGAETVHALKGINLNFRKNEFVSVLGPSGCGKTTLLNIVGGLDKYTKGDLIIAGKSTKTFVDKDWDVYRNHRVGFVFQSYNLIPHQSVLGNVELALTISGISKEERISRAKKALDRVGLSDKYHKKPNQLSGGQCQRVAIARALVNEPEILLADEPTGALDTETSIQIMALIKEISKERLVIMVTHNPALAEKYSTRIINLLDGELISDTNPLSDKDEIAEINISKDIKKLDKSKAKMSLKTGFGLSLKNLLSKKKRTFMTVFAGSIGIIGISLVLSISFGVQGYVAKMQGDMLSGNPIKISETAFDLNAMLSATPDAKKADIVKDAGFVNVESMIEALIKRSETTENMMVTNNITSEYIDFLKEMPKENVAAISYDYGINVENNIYTTAMFNDKDTIQNLSLSAIKQIYTSILGKTEYAEYSSFITSLNKVYSQSIPDEDYILSQYNVLEGKFAKEANEVMIVVNNDRQLADLLLVQLGYYTQDEFENIIFKFTDDIRYNDDLYKSKEKLNYSQLMDKTFTYYDNDTVFTRNTDLTAAFKYNPYKTDSFGEGLDLKVVGILEPKDDISFGSLESGFYFTDQLSSYILEQNNDSQVVNYLNMAQIGYYSSSEDLLKITYKYSYSYDGVVFENQSGYVGSINMFSELIANFTGGKKGPDIYIISLAELGGTTLPSEISIYPIDIPQKDLILEYLDTWNSEGDIRVNDVVLTRDSREDITYTDTLSIIMDMINSFIDVVTIALVGFTALSLLVSSVMIGIITYVSVVERTKEIGVIRSIGGRKRDVSFLFVAETFMLGLASGLFGVVVTYIFGGIINIITNNAISIGIAVLPVTTALIIITISILLTLISGVTPSRAAARKDPVVALRTE